MRNSRLTRAMALALALVSGVSVAARPLTENVLLVRLNGVPVPLGVITTAGASTTNATTASAFTIVGGSVLMVTCDASAVVSVGATASVTYTNASFGTVMSSGVPRYFALRDSDTSMAVAAAAAVNCAVAVMN